MSTASTETPGDRSSVLRLLVHRWPLALGVVAAVANLVAGPNRLIAAISVSVAAMCYLGAAALNRRWVAWAGIAVASLLMVVGVLVGLTWWLALAIVGAALLVAGLVLRVRRPPLTAQLLALLGYGALAVTAMQITPRAGLVLAGVVLACHAIWDVVHYRRNVVVYRSLAECCMAFDVLLGGGLVVVGLVG